MSSVKYSKQEYILCNLMQNIIINRSNSISNCQLRAHVYRQNTRYQKDIQEKRKNHEVLKNFGAQRGKHKHKEQE